MTNDDGGLPRSLSGYATLQVAVLIRWAVHSQMRTHASVLSRARQAPTGDKVGNLYDQLLLYRNQTHVRAVMVAGQVRVRDGVVLGADEAALRARVHRAAERLWK